jgi:hypothetical protein
MGMIFTGCISALQTLRDELQRRLAAVD